MRKFLATTILAVTATALSTAAIAYDLKPAPDSGIRNATIVNGNAGPGWDIGVTPEGVPVPYPAPVVVLTGNLYNSFASGHGTVVLDYLRDPAIRGGRNEDGAVRLEVGDCFWNPDGSKAPLYAVFNDGNAQVAFCDDRG